MNRNLSWADLVAHGDFLLRTLSIRIQVQGVEDDCGDTIFDWVEVSGVRGIHVYAKVDGEEIAIKPAWDPNHPSVLTVRLELR